MFCSYCGGKLEHESIFCTHCGGEVPSAQPQMTQAQLQLQMPHPSAQQTPAPARRPKKPKGKYLLFGACGTAAGAILMAIILLLSGVLGTADVSYVGGRIIEGPGFATPEGAAKAYLMGLKAQDMDAMLSAFAVESYVDNYNFEAQVEQLRIYQYGKVMPFPNTNDYTRRMNIAYRYSQIARQVMYQYMNFNTPDELNNGDTILLKELKEVSDFVKKFERDTKDYLFEDLEITGAMNPEDLVDIYKSERNQKNIANHAKTFGADIEDVADVAVTFMADGEVWVFCPQLVRYDGKWHMQSLQGNLAILLGTTVSEGGIIRLGSIL